jgi:hypothetical protein
MVMQKMAIPEWEGFDVVLKRWMVQSVVDPRI